MKTIRWTILGLWVVACGTVTARWYPQDHWYLVDERFDNSVGVGTADDLAIGESNSLYIALGNYDNPAYRAVRLYPKGHAEEGQIWQEIDLAPIVSAPGPRDAIRGIETGPDGSVYLWHYESKFRKFTADLTDLGDIIDLGSDKVRDFTLGPDGRIYVVLQMYVEGSWVGQVKIYDDTGTLVREWTQPEANLDAAFGQAHKIVVVHDTVYIGKGSNILRFDEFGEFLGSRTVTFSRLYAVASDGRLYGSVGAGGSLHVVPPQGSGRNIAGRGAATYGDGVAAAIGKHGHVYFLTGYSNAKKIEVYVRSPYTFHPSVVSPVPAPGVHSINQRPGTAILDIGYSVHDGDDELVTTAALAFINNGTSLDSLVKMNTLLEGTETHLGPGITTDADHHLVWDMDADLATNFVPVSVEILARDASPEIALDFVTIPSNGPDPELTISRVPLLNHQFMDIWYWLIATEDPAITFTAGEVRSATDTNLVLASGATTTSNGLDFIYGMLGVRPATSNEVLRAMEGPTPGSVTRDSPDLYVNRPRTSVAWSSFRFNEWGVDTTQTYYYYAESLYWVVATNSVP